MALSRPLLDADPASPSAVAALEDDPFYRTIAVDFADDVERRRAVLADYFSFAIQEAREVGRCVHLSDPALGVAVWRLPQSQAQRTRAAARKRAALKEILGAAGISNYHGIIDYMSPRAERLVAPNAWYLSIVAVKPGEQRRGLGRQLLVPTLAEADAVSTVCYLETFTPRTIGFYAGLGFVTRASFDEPTTRSRYWLMVRNPRASTGQSL